MKADGEFRKVVVITGATAGVGRAAAREFASRGFSLGLIARDRGRLLRTQKEMRKLGGRAEIFPMDVANPKKMEEAADKFAHDLGPIDIWINNAMVTVLSEFKDMTPKEFRRVTEVTYLGFVYGTMAALKHMLARDQGKIVQVGSALAYRGIPLQSAYCGAKHAIQGFTESVRTELLHQKSRVRISMVQLPALNTPQFNWCKTRLAHKPQPVPPIYQPEVAARAIYWAAFHDRREITVGFKNTLILWGNKFFPGLGDRYLARTGYQSQQTREPVEPDRANNLWQAVPGKFAARGDFDSRAKKSNPQFFFAAHPVILLLLVLTACGLILRALSAVT